jgi:tripartite-type tricarboxylate transporter receptor subunit TctC
MPWRFTKGQLVGFCIALLLAAALNHAAAQPFPSRPLRLVVGYAPGGGTDIIARLMATNVQTKLGQPVVVENRPGVGGNLASEIVARAPADGYTLLMAANTVAINPFLYAKQAFDVARDLTAVAMIANSPVLLVTHPGVAIRSVAELVSYAKANPGRLSYGTPGIGTPQHLATELFKSMTGTDMVHVPYKGGAPAMADLVGGQIQLSFAAFTSAYPLVQGSKLRALAIGDARRSPNHPDIPVIGETVRGYEVGIWYGIMAPAQTPREVLLRLNRELAAVIDQPDVRDRMQAQGYDKAIGSPEDMSSTVRADLDKWSRVVKEAGIRPE